MASNKTQRFGPTLMVTGATGSNYLNPAAAGANAVGYTATASYALVRKMRITNITTGAVTFSLFVGGTTGSASGTAFWGSAMSIPANTGADWQGFLRLDAADFLSGTASATNSLIWEGEGEVGLSG